MTVAMKVMTMRAIPIAFYSVASPGGVAGASAMPPTSKEVVEDTALEVAEGRLVVIWVIEGVA